MDEAVVTLNNISKSYKLYEAPSARLKEALHPFKKKYHRLFYALNNISLQARKGEIIGIVGRNGSGKSTLLKLIAGVIQPSQGTIAVNGKVSALLELGTGLNPQISGIQNIEFSGLMQGCNRDEIARRKEEIIAFADIGEFIHQPVSTYSSGMKARLGFSLATMIRPEILIIDEVLAVGDDLFQKKCYDRMNKLMNSGCTVLFVSHSTQTINQFCQRAYLLEHGELLLEGPSALVTRHYTKLLFSQNKNLVEAREEIRRLNADSSEKNRFLARSAGLKSVNATTREAEDEQRAVFLPDLKPKTTSVQTNGEATVSHVEIHTPDGERVNALVMGETYRLSYQVDFHADTQNVRFSTQIEGEKGLRISGYPIEIEAFSPLGKSRYLIRLDFPCLLLPGLYFISIFVTTPKENGERNRLYDIHDAIALKVFAEKKRRRWGIVDLFNDAVVTELKAGE